MVGHGGGRWRETEIRLVGASGGDYRVILDEGVEPEWHARPLGRLVLVLLLLLRMMLLLLRHRDCRCLVKRIIMKLGIGLQTVIGAGDAAGDSGNVRREVGGTLSSLRRGTGSAMEH